MSDLTDDGPALATPSLAGCSLARLDTAEETEDIREARRTRKIEDAEEALRASEERFRRIFQDAATGIAIVTTEGAFLEVNAAYARMLGYSATELASRDVVSVTHPDERPWCHARLRELLAGERESLVFETRYLAKGGGTVWARLSVSAQRAASGQPVRIIAVAEDITEKKRTEEELEHSQALLRMASRVGRLGGWRIEVPDLSMTWSDEVREIHEAPKSDAPTVDEVIERYVPEHRGRLREVFQACLEHGEPFDEELQIITAKGRRVWVRLTAEAVWDAQGRIVRVQGALQDISERKRAERSRLENRQRLRQIADAMPFVIWSARPDGDLDYGNQALTDLSGIAGDEVSNGRWLQAVHPDDVARSEAVCREAVAAGTRYTDELRIRRAADGSYRWHLVQGVPIRDESGEIVAWYGTAIDIHDQKLAEVEVRHLAERLTTTLESITDAFFTVDPDWRLTYLNPEAERLWQRSRDELLGQELWDLLPSGPDCPLERALRRAMDENTHVEFEEICAPLGAWLGGRAYPSSQGLAVYFRDVTERREAREVLRASEERFRLLAKASHDAIWDWDLGTGAVWWNEGLEVLFGYRGDRTPVTVQAWLASIHPDDRPRVDAELRHVLDAGGESWSSEFRFRRADGSYAYVLDRGHVIRAADGKATRMIGGMTDLTERRQAEERLADLAALLDKARDAILVRDLEHRILYWNRSAERLYGWTSAEAVGRVSEELLYKDPAAFRAATEATLAHGEWIGEIEQVTKDGRVRIVESRWTLVRDDQGRPKSILATNTDVTDRKKLEQQLLRTQRLESIGTLAGGIAHDLNNVLAPILMAVQMLREHEVDDERLEDLATIEACAQRGAAMVRQLLFFARGADGQRTKVDLGRIARELEKLVRETFPKDIAFRLHAPRELWPVTGDPTQLNQVLMNLCVNARDAMPEGGELVVTLDQAVMDEVYAGMNVDAAPGAYVVLKVEDSGVGMPPEVLERLFEPFFTTKEVGQGTGLGLSSAHAIARSHGGFITVYSEVGRGTTFKVYLPADPSEKETAQVAIEQSALPRGRGELVLVVDDEESIRKVARRTLERFGYRVLLAAHGAEAVALYAQHRDEVAVVLTDMAMPVMDGPATIVALRSMNPRVRIIGSSGLNANSHAAKAVGAGVEHFVPKPYTAETMLRVLREVLSSGD